MSHIDDSYLQGDDYNDCAKNVLETIRLFDSLGFTIHPSKSSLIPTQKLIILGFVIDSVEMKVYPTEEKIEKIKNACKELLQNSRPTIRQVASVLGFLISIFPAALFGPLHFRELDMDKTEALKLRKGDFDKHMFLSKKACLELNWWIDSADTLYKPICNTLPELTLFTDASNQGWGSVLNKCRIGGQWTTLEANNHINYLEMLAVFLALKASSHLSGKHVCIRIDNTTAVADIGKMGTSHLEWSLDRTIYDRGIHHLGLQPTIDLFASRLNYKIKPFISYQPDPEAKIVNAFTVSWQPYLFYAFPPFSIISLVLQKIQREKSTGILVAPKWPTQPWWPVLMRMIVQNPIILPQTDKLLILPTNPELLHPLHQKLTLLMCHLSGNPSKIKDFRAKLCPSSCLRGDKVHKSNIPRTSENGNSTVVDGKLVTFQQL